MNTSLTVFNISSIVSIILLIAFGICIKLNISEKICDFLLKMIIFSISFVMSSSLMILLLLCINTIK